jgi:hypothetical protein
MAKLRQRAVLRRKAPLRLRTTESRNRYGDFARGGPNESIKVGQIRLSNAASYNPIVV